MTIKIEEAGRQARREAFAALLLWCAGLAAYAGCGPGAGAQVDGPTDPPPSNPTGFGTADCVPYTCEYLRAACGRPGDGCGGEPLDCGECPAGSACEHPPDLGAAFSAGESLAWCSPDLGAASFAGPAVERLSDWCADNGVECGPVIDVQGDVTDCGACAPGFACGNWPGRCCGERSATESAVACTCGLPRLLSWCFVQPEPGCVETPLPGDSVGAWCCP